MPSPENILCVISEDQKRDYESDFKGFDQLNVQLKVESSPEEAISKIGDMNPLMIILGALVEDYEGIELLTMILEQHRDFDKPVVVLPDKEDGLPPMVHSHSPTTGKSSVESISFEEVVGLVASLQQETPTLRKAVQGDHAVAPPGNDGDLELDEMSTQTKLFKENSTARRLSHLFDNAPIESLPASSAYSGRKRLDRASASLELTPRVNMVPAMLKKLPRIASPVPKAAVEEPEAPPRETADTAPPTDRPAEVLEGDGATATNTNSIGADNVADSIDLQIDDPLQKRALWAGKLKWIAAAAALVVLAIVAALLLVGGDNGKAAVASEAKVVHRPIAGKPIGEAAEMSFTPDAVEEKSPDGKEASGEGASGEGASGEEASGEEAGGEGASGEAAAPDESPASSPPSANERVMPLVFKSGSASPRISDSRALMAVVADLNAKPEAHIVLTGYTSSEGETMDNFGLAIKRAENVMKLLVNRGVPAKQFEIKSHGANHPIASNETESDRAKNRRVTVQIVP